ncbi:citryl-CoA lyase [Sporosarcina sp. Marseille-Q4063]|uniref:citryl-CoA lyase n=1 Tax=Sporosarcina sp. Marseille-Q4063 TaxID=2810514 RepID=UPI001BAF8437|nr:citryl-CoA lyase [Sporosarcina sp. Marseille-Q4063]QUW21281.1 citryl-CoA lyase [Sporosarcina sp. Marseille-Q4063]
MKFQTKIAVSDLDNIQVHGYDLCSDLIGTVNLGDMAYISAKGNIPTKEESDMLNAIMVALTEHGFTPSSISARLTILGAPESLQNAVAAGILGAGSVYLGSMEFTAKMLQEAFVQQKEVSVEILAKTVVEKYEGEKIPGFGHPIHKVEDPRTTRLFQLAEELGFKGHHCKLVLEVQKQINIKKKTPIVLNASGAVAAILSDMDFKWSIVKCFSLAARAVGLIGHIIEEQQNGVSQKLWDYIQENTEYRP